MLKKILIAIGLLCVIVFTALFMLSLSSTSEHITYGVSFSKFRAEELGLDWKKVFIATLDDLKIRHYRLSAYWHDIESEKGKFDFSNLDFQMKEAQKRGADVILGVGRRLPGWPECHEPQWAHGLSKEEKQQELLSYITAVVDHYKDAPNLLYWQVENEAFLGIYAQYFCGDFFDVEFFEKEIALVRSLDSSHKIFLTDSGELSFWYPAYSRSDVFGTSVYLYVWNHRFGPIRYPMTPAFFRVKHNLIKLLAHDKPAIISELSLEPWLLTPIADTPIEEQLKRMDMSKFDEIINFAAHTDFDTQYLWGVEWWYYMQGKDHGEFWQKAKEIYLK